MLGAICRVAGVMRLVSILSAARIVSIYLDVRCHASADDYTRTSIQDMRFYCALNTIELLVTPNCICYLNQSEEDFYEYV